MSGTVVAGWREELLDVVRRWAHRRPPEQRGLRRVGIALRAGGPGWYRVDLGGDTTGPSEPDVLRHLTLVHPATAARHHVLDAETTGQTLHLRVSAHVDDPRLELHASLAAHHVTALREALESLDDPGLAADLAEGRVGRRARALSLPGLDAEQQQAYAACHSAGLHLVWGPPGTGKTRVLTRAVDDLLARGQRVLLVSPTGVHVDHALLAALRHRHPGPATAVRVGLPQLPEIARDAHVSLAHLVARQATKITRRRELAEQELVRRTAPARKLAALAEQLRGFDEAGYEHAVALEQHERQRERAAEAFAAAWYAAREAATEHERAEAGRDQSVQRRTALGPAANLLAEAAGLEGELAELNASHQRRNEDWQAARAMLHAHDEQGTELAAAGRWARLRHRFATRVHEQRQARLRSQVDETRRELDRTAEQTEALAADLRTRIDRLRAQAAPVDEDDVRATERDHEHATTREAEARERLAATNAAASAAGEELKAAEALPRLTAEHWNVLVDARARGIPDMLAQRAELQVALAAAQPQIQELERKQDALATELDRARPNLERALVRDARLVATTLHQALTHPAVLDVPYDVVLVDDAGMALLPELVAVLARARRTAVLFGELRQGEPVLPAKLNPHRPDVKAWLGRDAFACCGITSPKLARQRCVALRTQYRLPAEITELVNAVAYDGALVPARAAGDGTPPVVLVDTDGLDDAAVAALAAAIARRHREQGEVVEALTAPGPPTETTVDSGVRGREFDVTIADLGVAGAAPREAARLLTLAATRTRRNLYLLGSAALLRGAPATSPLGALAAMLAEGRIRALPASGLIPDEIPPAREDLSG